jgi:hypothetical protein
MSRLKDNGHPHNKQSASRVSITFTLVDLLTATTHLYSDIKALLHRKDTGLLHGSSSRLGEAFCVLPQLEAAISYPLYIHLDMRNSVP